MNNPTESLTEMLNRRLRELGFAQADVDIEYMHSFGEIDAISFTGTVLPDNALEAYLAWLNRELTGRERVRKLRELPFHRAVFDLVEPYADAEVYLLANDSWPHHSMVNADFRVFSGEEVERAVTEEPDILPAELERLASWSSDDWYDWHIDWSDALKVIHDQVCITLEEEGNAYLLNEQLSCA